MNAPAPASPVAIVVDRHGDVERVTVTGRDRLVVLAEALHLWSLQRPWPVNAMPPDVYPHRDGLWLSLIHRWHEPATEEV